MRFIVVSAALILAACVPAIAQQANPNHDIRWAAATGCATATYVWVPADHQCEAPGAGAGTGTCTSGQYETGDATGGPTCAQVAYSQVSGRPSIPSLTPLSSATAHNWVQYIDSTGAQNLARPACADLSDSASGCNAAAYSLPAGTSSTLGGVKPDGTSIQNSSGAISAATATSFQVSLASSNTTLTSTSTFYDGPTSGSQVAGTYFVTATATIGKASATTQTTVVCKLWDGTTTFASTEAELSYVSSAAITYAAVTLSAVITESSSATFKMSCEPQTASEVMYYQTPTGTLGNAVTISGFRLK